MPARHLVEGVGGQAGSIYSGLANFCGLDRCGHKTTCYLARNDLGAGLARRCPSIGSKVVSASAPISMPTRLRREGPKVPNDDAIGVGDQTNTTRAGE